MTDVPDSAATANRGFTGSLQWFVVAAIGMTMLSLAAVHAPPRIKLLGLFSIGVGVVAGLAFGWLARALDVKRSKALLSMTLLLIFAGLAFATIESHRIWSATEWEAFENSPNGKIARQSAMNQTLPKDFKTSLQESIDRQRQELSFENYLSRRVSALGNWRKPWPLVFWISEITIAAFAGGWICWRQADAASLPKSTSRQS